MHFFFEKAAIRKIELFRSKTRTSQGLLFLFGFLNLHVITLEYP